VTWREVHESGPRTGSRDHRITGRSRTLLQLYLYWMEERNSSSRPGDTSRTRSCPLRARSSLLSVPAPRSSPLSLHMNPFEAFRRPASAAAERPLDLAPRAAPPPAKCSRTSGPPVVTSPPKASLATRTLSHQPHHWQDVYSALQTARSGRTSAVDVFHDFLLSLSSQPEPVFQALVAALFSVQCRDGVALAAFQRLQLSLGGAATLEAVRACSLETLEEACSTLNFRQSKAKFVKACAEAVHSRFSGAMPTSVAQLQTLPGVGPKLARLIAAVSFPPNRSGCSQGVIVDTHVHRVAQRLGWSAGRSAEATRLSLEGWLPEEHWDEVSLLLIGFGQDVCGAQRPKCGECPLRQWCPSSAAAPLDAARESNEW